MPRKTFHNLTKERRIEIIMVCFEEFTLNDYDNASVSRIVRRLGIAKGSFYRYFESKKDLYLFLLDQATTMRMENVKELFESPIENFFTLFEKNFAKKILFDLSFPLQSAFLYNSMQERNNEELGNLLIRSKEMIIELLTPVIESCKQRGMLRTDIQTDVLAYVIVQVQLGIYDFLMIRYNTDFRNNIKEQKPVFAISEKDILSTVKEFSKVLEHGFSR
jgi:TetR/AcrR family transcriptional regulator